MYIILLCWSVEGNEVRSPISLWQVGGRFVAAMFMHINVGKEIIQGILMMKYSVNHHKNFTNVYPAFLLGFCQFFMSITTEVMVMLILTSLHDTQEVMIKWVAFARVGKVPEYYMTCVTSLKGHKLIIADGFVHLLIWGDSGARGGVRCEV